MSNDKCEYCGTPADSPNYAYHKCISEVKSRVTLCPCLHETYGYTIKDETLTVLRDLDPYEFPASFFSLKMGSIDYHAEELQLIRIINVNTGTSYELNFGEFIAKRTKLPDSYYTKPEHWHRKASNEMQLGMDFADKFAKDDEALNKFFGKGIVTGAPVEKEGKTYYPVQFGHTTGKFYEGDLAKVE